MKNKIFYSVIFILLFIGEATASSFKEANHIFCPKIGEEFVYTINWGVVPAGSASIKIDSIIQCGETKCYRIKTSTRTNSLFDKIYKVRDSIESYVEKSFLRSHYYNKNQQEGKFRRNEEILFDFKKEKLQLIRNGKIKKVITINKDEDLLDPFAVLYYIRSIPLQVGDRVTIRVTDGNAVYLINLDVVKREKIKTWLGTYKCLKIEPKMQSIEGIFHKKKKAKIFVWLTDDNRRIPVKLQSEVTFGSFQGILKEIKYP